MTESMERTDLETTYRTAIQSEPDRPEPYFQLVERLLTTKGRSEEAYRMVIRGMTLDPGAPKGRVLFRKTVDPTETDAWLLILPSLLDYLKERPDDYETLEFAAEGLIRLIASGDTASPLFLLDRTGGVFDDLRITLQALDTRRKPTAEIVESCESAVRQWINRLKSDID
jgi:hypothetical protein